MTKLSTKDVAKLARLARLSLTEKELELYAREFTALLAYVEQLQAADTEGLNPTYQVTGLTTVTRPDELIDYGTSQKDLLKNVPSVQEGHIKVKRMIV